VLELLEELAQLEGKLATVRHLGDGAIVLAIDAPAHDRRAARAGVALGTAIAGVAFLTGDAALARSSDKLPSLTRALAGIISTRDE